MCVLWEAIGTRQTLSRWGTGPPGSSVTDHGTERQQVLAVGITRVCLEKSRCVRDDWGVLEILGTMPHVIGASGSSQPWTFQFFEPHSMFCLSVFRWAPAPVTNRALLSAVLFLSVYLLGCSWWRYLPMANLLGLHNAIYRLIDNKFKTMYWSWWQQYVFNSYVTSRYIG